MNDFPLSVLHTRYLVTHEGRVISLRPGYRPREINPIPDRSGYPSVRVHIMGRQWHFAVHKLVAYYFLPPQPSPKHELRHVDGNKLNPRASNLEWGTRKDNAADRERHGRTSRGEKHSLAIRAGLLKRARLAKEAQ